jgi:hypothetical protein
MKTSRRVALIASVVVSTTAAMAQSQSASYRLVRSTVNGSGGPSASASYRAAASLGQESVVATSASARYVVQSGFWSFLGTGLAPVTLHVNNTTGDPEDPILTWTGNGASYQIHRSANCGNVLESFLANETGLTYTDTATPAQPLLCYSVLATPRVLLVTPVP